MSSAIAVASIVAILPVATSTLAAAAPVVTFVVSATLTAIVSVPARINVSVLSNVPVPTVVPPEPVLLTVAETVPASSSIVTATVPVEVLAKSADSPVIVKPPAPVVVSVWPSAKALATIAVAPVLDIELEAVPVVNWPVVPVPVTASAPVYAVAVKSPLANATVASFAPVSVNTWPSVSAVAVTASVPVRSVPNPNVIVATEAIVMS